MTDRSTEQPEPAGKPGLSRRQLLARGAVAGAAVWVAPVVLSTPAYAQTAGTTRQCNNFHGVRMVRGTTHDLFQAVKDWPDPDFVDGAIADTGILAAPNTQNVCAQITQWRLDHPDVTVTFDPNNVPTLVSAPNHDPWVVLLPAGPVPGSIDDAQFVIGYGRAGNLCCPAVIDPNPPSPDQAGRRLLFPSCHQNAQIHSVQIIYCMP